MILLIQAFVLQEASCTYLLLHWTDPASDKLPAAGPNFSFAYAVYTPCNIWQYCHLVIKMATLFVFLLYPRLNLAIHCNTIISWLQVISLGKIFTLLHRRYTAKKEQKKELTEYSCAFSGSKHENGAAVGEADRTTSPTYLSSFLNFNKGIIAFVVH